jgi:hypothetical protein
MVAGNDRLLYISTDARLLDSGATRVDPVVALRHE